MAPLFGASKFDSHFPHHLEKEEYWRMLAAWKKRKVFLLSINEGKIVQSKMFFAFLLPQP
jgi:hypothetical protein